MRSLPVPSYIPRNERVFATSQHTFPRNSPTSASQARYGASSRHTIVLSESIVQRIHPTLLGKLTQLKNPPPKGHSPATQRGLLSTSAQINLHARISLHCRTRRGESFPGWMAVYFSYYLCGLMDSGSFVACHCFRSRSLYSTKMDLARFWSSAALFEFGQISAGYCSRCSRDLSFGNCRWKGWLEEIFLLVCESSFLDWGEVRWRKKFTMSLGMKIYFVRFRLDERI